MKVNSIVFIFVHTNLKNAMNSFQQLISLKPIVLVRDNHSASERTITGSYPVKQNDSIYHMICLDRPLENGSCYIRMQDVIEIVQINQ